MVYTPKSKAAKPAAEKKPEEKKPETYSYTIKF